MNAGGFLNNVEVREIEPGNNGLVATSDIKAGDVVMFIPFEFTVNEIIAENTPSFKYAKE